MSVMLIAEWGQSHLGNLDRALEQVEVTARAGWDVYKTQVFDPDLLCGPSAQRYWDEQLGGSASQAETFKRNGFLTPDQLREVKATCEFVGIRFCATPFDLPSVDLLEDLGVELVKVASADVVFHHLLRRVAKMHVPVVLSTGAASLSEVIRAVDVLESAGVEYLTLLACTLDYPTEASNAHLRRMQTLRRLGHRIGYSDHTQNLETALAATVLGANVLERHCTLKRSSVCPDDKMALHQHLMPEYARLASLGRLMRGTNSVYPLFTELSAREQARRSAHAVRDLDTATRVRSEDLVWKRPAVGGFTPDREDELVGRYLRRPVQAGEQITEEMLDI